MIKKTEELLCLAVVGALCLFSAVAIATRAIAHDAEPSPVADAASIFNAKCAKCQNELKPGAKFCEECGTKVG